MSKWESLHASAMKCTKVEAKAMAFTGSHTGRWRGYMDIPGMYSKYSVDVYIPTYSTYMYSRKSGTG